MTTDNVTVKEMQEAKKLMEANIRSAILAEVDLFTKETGLSVRDIKLKTEQHYKVGAPLQLKVLFVDCHIDM